MVTEYKNIPISQIVPNPEQPRETFDREKLKELAESILSNGLINSITVRKKGKQYEIVAGERRWKAHQIAKIKNISAKIKEYKSEGQVAVESLIENVQREDLNPFEKAKFMVRIKDIEGIKTYQELAKRIGMSYPAVKMSLKYLNVDEEVRKKVSEDTLGERQARVLGTISNKEEQRKVANISEGKSIRETEKIVTIYKKSTSEVKDALLDDKITTDQAERISKLKTEPERKKAIQEHQSLAIVERGIERNVEQQKTAKENREFDKQLIQAGNWIASFRGSVSDTHKQIEKTIKILLVSTKFIPMMDEAQLKKLNNELEDFIETLERGEQLATQIQEKIE